MSFDNDFSSTIARLPRLNQPGWKPPEEDVVAPPPQSAQEAEARASGSDFNCKNLYFCTRELADQ